jgi:hypothetical protein
MDCRPVYIFRLSDRANSISNLNTVYFYATETGFLDIIWAIFRFQRCRASMILPSFKDEVKWESNRNLNISLPLGSTETQVSYC